MLTAHLVLSAVHILVSAAPAPEEVAARCVAELAAGDADAVFARYSPEMAAAVPREKNTPFVANLRRDLGALKSTRLSSTVRRGPFPTFNHVVQFERGTVLVAITVDGAGRVAGLQVKPAPVEDEAAARLDTYETRAVLSLPFRGEWMATNAARDGANPHFTNPNQRFAVDWVMVDAAGKTFRTDGTRNADFLCWGQDMLAPADGTVVIVVDGVPDNEPRKEMDRYNVAGNQVVLDLGNGEFALFAHAVPGSITVRVGDKVKRGQVLARVGNSGNSSEPHLHFQLANHPRLFRAQALPAPFSDVTVNGTRRARAQPGEGDRVK